MQQAAKRLKVAVLVVVVAIVASLALMPGGAWADEAVATTDEASYATLQEAIDGAEDGDVVVLTQDVTLDAQLVIVDKTITLDLGGYTLTIAGEATEAGIVVCGASAVVIQNGTIDDVRGADEEVADVVTIQVFNAASLETVDLVVQAVTPSEVGAQNVVLQAGTAEELDDPADVPTVTLGAGTVILDAALAVEGEETDEATEDEDEAEVESGLVVGVLVIGANCEATEADDEADDADEADEDYAGTTLIVAEGALIEVSGNAIESSTETWGDTIVVEDGATIISTCGYGIYQPTCGTVTILGGTITGVCALYEGVSVDEDSGEAATEEAVEEEAVEEEAVEEEATEDIVVAASEAAEAEDAEDDADADEAEAAADDETSLTILTILGGTFISTSEELSAVYSENCEGFIVAGSFSTEVDDSLVYETSSVEESAEEETSYEVVGAVQAEDYTGVYDGLAHTGTVSFSSYADGLETSVVYSEDGEDYSLTEAPTYTNVGTYTVYYQATYGSYTAEGSFTVEITPATLTVTYAGETVAYGTEPELALTIEGFVNGESADSDTAFVSPSVSADGCTAEGSYELTPAGGSATNYEFAYVAGTLTVTHNLYYVEEVASTCAAAGTAAHYACTGCSTLFSDAEGTTTVEAADLSLAALDHSYDDGAVTKAATCEETGTFTYTCTVCGATIEESIAALGHAYEATWTWSDDLSSATLTLTCANDSSHFVFIDSIVTTSAVTTAATAEADGVITYTAQATYNGTGYTDTRTATYEYTGDASSVETLSDETSTDDATTEETDEAEETTDASTTDESATEDAAAESSELEAASTSSEEAPANESTGDTALSNSGDDTMNIVIIVLAIAIIAVAVALIAFVVKRRNSR